jgi:O-antigen/teichoic acid export membrane protein
LGRDQAANVGQRTVTSGRKFARNSALNLTGTLLPLVLAVLAMPPLVRGMGAERFGILTLAWAAIGYFGLFELGLSRALTQAVAHRIGANRNGELPALVWTALLLLLVLGVLGAVVLAAATPTLITRVLNVPAGLQHEAIVSFYILAASLPFVVTTAGLRGLMEAHQHFGVVTALRIPLLAFMLLGPLLVLPFSKSLVPAVLMLAIGRVLAWTAHLVVCLRRYAYLHEASPSVQAASLGPLLRYGGWTTVSNIVSPIMVYVDRFLIGALLPMAAVAAYVTPYEVVTKLSVIPASVLAAMFPALAATFSSDRQHMIYLYDRALRSVVLLIFPVILVAIALAQDGMRIWMGGAMPPESAVVLQWLALGVFINSIAQVPYVALQSAGRPDLIAKLHLLELPLYAVSIWFFARWFGLVGVAIAWTLRVTIDAIALVLVARRTLQLPIMPQLGSPWTLPLMLMALAGAVLPTNAVSRIAYVVVMGGVFVATAWRGLLSAPERHALVSSIRSPRTAFVETTEGLA